MIIETPKARKFPRTFWIRLFTIFFILLALLLSAFVFTNLWRDSNSSDFSRNSKSLGGRYYSYQQKVYVNIPVQGYYLLPGVNSASFQVYSSRYLAPLAKDNQSVFCGTHIIQGLQPDSVIYTSLGYISDGHNTYFCSQERKNPDYYWWHEIVHDNDYDNPDRPRRRDFILSRVENVIYGNLHTWGENYLSDGLHLFYEGVMIPDADGGSVQLIHYGQGRLKDIVHDRYLADNTRVYYQGQPLPDANPDAFSAFSPDSDQWQTDYGRDTKTDTYYFGAIPFPKIIEGKETRGLSLLVADRDRANHELFINENGIFYRDYQGKKFKCAGPNPFGSNNPQRISENYAAGVWANAKDTIILSSYDVWGKKSRGLVSRNTVLSVLPDVSLSDWHLVETFERNGRVTGTLWRAKGNYYFSSTSARNIGMEESFYLVVDYPQFKQQLQQEKQITKTLKEQYLRSVREMPEVNNISHAKSSYSFWNQI
ncbi:DKNYY domain-containing protein [Jinshanibacter sp. LJY008]|uniref:DKNYY domain-containing protein n=1 Tax=Limnobaculum eriocheiris TaxID=2897391 RepID=A0A9X1N0I4_9GAMM|nr:DKNYY domain-containing protein [Limnobaculum eriocheiris]MCD1127575.1 DKNYY domain-containing protein [Limnobaculum eriocheiris]